MSFAARQWIGLDTVAFDWRARIGPLRLITVRDALVDDAPRSEVRFLGGFQLGSAPGGPSLLKGQVMRYLAELPWAPDAIHPSQHKARLAHQRSGHPRDRALRRRPSGRGGDTGRPRPGSVASGRPPPDRGGGYCRTTMARQVLRLPMAPGQMAAVSGRSRVDPRWPTCNCLARINSAMGNDMIGCLAGCSR
jgi:hypothetical protein